MNTNIYIPLSIATAKKHLRRASAGLQTMTRPDFMRAYSSLAYLYPGFHPDSIGDWNGPRDIIRVAREAWRRAKAGELTAEELYPYEASKAGIHQHYGSSQREHEPAETLKC